MTYDEIISVHALLTKREDEIKELHQLRRSDADELEELSNQFRVCPKCRQAFCNTAVDESMEAEPFKGLT